jgi:hypothetical protein
VASSACDANLREHVAERPPPLQKNYGGAPTGKFLENESELGRTRFPGSMVFHEEPEPSRDEARKSPLLNSKVIPGPYPETQLSG